MLARKPARPLWATLMIIFGALLMLFSGSTIVGMRALTHRYDAAVHKAPLLDVSARASAPAAGGLIQTSLTGPLNYLLLGSDARDGDPSNGQRSDTIIVLHIPASMDRAYLISIPRDLRVSIPADPAHNYGGGTEKINGAFNYGGGGTGGFQLLSRTLTRLIGIKFDGAAIINFDGFRQVVGILGGVDMCVDQLTRSIHTHAVYKPGCQHLAPWQALDYVRQRETLPNGDYDRQRHQQQFLKALFQQALHKGATSPIALDRIIRALGSALTVDTNGVSLEELVFSLRAIQPSNLVGIKLPSYPTMLGGISYVLPDPGAGTLYRALASDTVDTWLMGNQNWVNHI